MPYHTHGLYPTFALHTGDSVVVLVQHIPVALCPQMMTIMFKLFDFSCLTVSLSSLGLTHSTAYGSPLKQQLNVRSINSKISQILKVVGSRILHSSIIHPCSSPKTNTCRSPWCNSSHGVWVSYQSYIYPRTNSRPEVREPLKSDVRTTRIAGEDGVFVMCMYSS